MFAVGLTRIDKSKIILRGLREISQRDGVGFGGAACLDDFRGPIRITTGDLTSIGRAGFTACVGVNRAEA